MQLVSPKRRTRWKDGREEKVISVSSQSLYFGSVGDVFRAAGTGGHWRELFHEFAQIQIIAMA